MRLHLPESRILSFLFAALSACALQGCAKPVENQVIPGKTTVAEASMLLGEPKATIVPVSRPQAKLLDYNHPLNCRTQVENGVVVATYCDPEESESTLQAWRHKWLGQNPRFERIPGTEDPHGRSLYQLTAPSLGMAVVYDKSSDRVKRVVKFAPR